MHITQSDINASDYMDRMEEHFGADDVMPSANAASLFPNGASTDAELSKMTAQSLVVVAAKCITGTKSGAENATHSRKLAIELCAFAACVALQNDDTTGTKLAQTMAQTLIKGCKTATCASGRVDTFTHQYGAGYTPVRGNFLTLQYVPLTFSTEPTEQGEMTVMLDSDKNIKAHVLVEGSTDNKKGSNNQHVIGVPQFVKRSLVTALHCLNR